MLEAVKARVRSFGYEPQGADDEILAFCIGKVESTIKNDCNVSEIPEGLFHIAVDMAVGEFFSVKKTFAPDSLSTLDLSGFAVKELKEGDATIAFATGEGAQTDEQRLDALINYLLTNGREQFACFRKIRW